MGMFRFGTGSHSLLTHLVLGSHSLLTPMVLDSLHSLTWSEYLTFYPSPCASMRNAVVFIGLTPRRRAEHSLCIGFQGNQAHYATNISHGIFYGHTWFLFRDESVGHFYTRGTSSCPSGNWWNQSSAVAIHVHGARQSHIVPLQHTFPKYSLNPFHLYNAI